MKRTFSLLALFALCPLAAASEIVSYRNLADLAANGDAKITAKVELRAAQPGRLVLPLGFSKADNLVLLAPTSGAKLVADHGKRNAVQFELASDVPAELALEFAFEVPALMAAPKVEPGKKPELAAGAALVKHRFVNTQETPIETYRLEVLLPKGIQVQEIAEQTPKPKRTDVLPRVRLDAKEGRQSAALQLSGLKQGDATAMTIETVSEHRSVGWLLAGLALSMFYLLNFKDLVVRKPA